MIISYKVKLAYPRPRLKVRQPKSIQGFELANCASVLLKSEAEICATRGAII